MVEYVAGFLFNTSGDVVVLIEKQKPIWQRGLLNGVGGKIEPGETPTQAMQREFTEETGVEVTAWKQFAKLQGADFTVYFFSSFQSLDVVKSIRTTTNEIVAIYEVLDLWELPTIPNLKWLIPMAISMYAGETAASFDITELAGEKQ